MDDEDVSELVKILNIPPSRRTKSHIQLIFDRLRSVQSLTKLRDTELTKACYASKYKSADKNSKIYRKGEVVQGWYVLLSGSVFVNSSMFLPLISFGHDPYGKKRLSDCLALENSDILYVDISSSTGKGKDSPRQQLVGVKHSLDSTTSGLDRSDSAKKTHHNSSTNSSFQREKSSDTNSNTDSPMIDMSKPHQTTTSSKNHHIRNPSLISSSSNHSSQHINRDNVKEVFEKDPQDRTEDDIDILADYTKTLPAFMNLTDPVRRKLCSYMVFVQIDLAGTLVLGDQEELDSWSVILNGKVKVTYEDETTNELEFGDDFGVRPTLDRQVHQGVMQTLQNDCQFICIAQHDYYNVLHESQDAQRRVLDPKSGEVCMIEERREFDHDIRTSSMKIDRIYPSEPSNNLNERDTMSYEEEMNFNQNLNLSNERHGYVVIRGTPEALLEQLMDHETQTDPTFIQDFLLTSRLFLEDRTIIAKKLLSWYDQPAYRKKVIKIFLYWVNHHFQSDFDIDEEMLDYLKQLEALLAKNKMVKSGTNGSLPGGDSTSHHSGDQLSVNSGNDRDSGTGTAAGSSSLHTNDNSLSIHNDTLSNQQQLLHLLVHQQAKPRKVVINRELTARRDLPFGILGGNEVGFPLFVSSITSQIQSDQSVHLKEGDQLIEINGRSLVTISDETDHNLGYRVCKSTNMQDAIALLRNNIHLTVTVKTNPFGYKYMLSELKNPESMERQDRLAKRQKEIMEDQNIIREKEKQEEQKRKSKYDISG